MSRISHRAQDKLEALLNRHPDGYFAPAYVDACATWFAGLTEPERRVAALALRAHLDGDEAGAHKIVRVLPAAPKCPVRAEAGIHR